MLSPSQTQKQQRIECLLSDGLSVETIAMMTATSVRYVNNFVNSKSNKPMKTTHTLGPWKYTKVVIKRTPKHGETSQIYSIQATSESKWDGKSIAKVEAVDLSEENGPLSLNPFKYDNKEAEANARLISAAPELLDALVSAYSFMVTDGNYQGRNILETIKNVILKATQP